MKVTIEYSILKGRPLQKSAVATGAKVISDKQVPPDNSADFPLHRIECYVADESQAARIICELLGFGMPT
jgi:hypothetical protein